MLLTTTLLLMTRLLATLTTFNYLLSINKLFFSFTQAIMQIQKSPTFIGNDYLTVIHVGAEIQTF